MTEPSELPIFASKRKAELLSSIPIHGSRRFPYTVLDVFTDVPLEGNPLAVVHDADPIEAGVMLRFARETRLSETCFVQTASAKGLKSLVAERP